MEKIKFKFIDKASKTDNEQLRPSLTYWQDAWRRLKKNKLAMAGLIGVIFIVVFGLLGPFFTPYSYEEQELDYANIPPKLEIRHVQGEDYVYLSRDYKLLVVTSDGDLIRRLDNVNKDVINRIYTYDYNGNEIADEGDIFVDFSYRVDPLKKDLGIEFTIQYGDNIVEQPEDTVKNGNYRWGTDNLGRDIQTRVMFGARISLTVALVATVVNLFIGVTYGSISGYIGGTTDNIMMRIVDIINSIPLLLYVILLMMLFENGGGLWTIIIALASVYWVGMARLVRAQVLGLKEQEYVLAAKTIGVSGSKIIARHLIPNAMGPIIVSMTMMIPSAVFTESFLSFIGLGVSAPQASWGTLASDALGSLVSYPYMLFYPAAAIALTMLAFNFLGDGLRDALDPRLRKG